MKNNLENILLTAIVPMYNSADYLERTLKSIVSMVDSKDIRVQILLIDDGSTDNTLLIANKYVEKYSFFKIYKNHHRGVSAARNFGIKKAEGKYITFLDSDDTFNPDFLLKLKTFISKEPDIIICDLDKNIYISNLSKEKKINVLQIINHKVGSEGINSKIYKRSFLNNNDLNFNTNLVIGEDALFFYSAVTLAKSIIMSTFKFYFIGESHTLSKFQPLLLKSEKKFIQQLDILFSYYKNASNYNEIRLIYKKYCRKAFLRLMQQFYTPLYFQKKKDYFQIKKELLILINQWNLSSSYFNSEYDFLLSKRQRLYRYLMKVNWFKLIFILEYFFDKK